MVELGRGIYRRFKNVIPRVAAMILFYVDETGNRAPVRAGRPEGDQQWLYVLTAVSLYEHRWHGFEKTISRTKRRLLQQINDRRGVLLDLAGCEVKSNWVRVDTERKKAPISFRLGAGGINGPHRSILSPTFSPPHAYLVRLGRQALFAEMSPIKKPAPAESTGAGED